MVIGYRTLETPSLVRLHQWLVPSAIKRLGTKSRRHLKVIKRLVFKICQLSEVCIGRRWHCLVEGAGESAVSWTKEAWVSSKHGIQCLKEAKGNAEAILDCRKNLHSSLDGQVQCSNKESDQIWLPPLLNSILYFPCQPGIFILTKQDSLLCSFLFCICRHQIGWYQWPIRSAVKRLGTKFKRH